MADFPRERFRSLETLGRGNRRVLDYWRSLCNGPGLPSRTSFSPAQIKSSLSRLMLMQIWPQERVVCRLSGTDIVRAAGVNLTGLDIIEQSPQAFRKERLARYSNCFDGFIHRSVRNMPNMNGETIRSELLILPFRDLREDGSKVALVSADWVTERDDRLRAVSDAFIVPEFAEYLPV